MICSFKKKSGTGDYTRFPEKIIRAACSKNIFGADFNPAPWIDKLIKSGYPFLNDWEQAGEKLHTIREDINDRYAVGKLLQLAINSRQKNYCQFLPDVEILLVQKLEILSATHTVVCDGKTLSKQQIIKLANNDGFDNVFDFFEWFSEPFKGKLCIWTPGIKYE